MLNNHLEIETILVKPFMSRIVSNETKRTLNCYEPLQLIDIDFLG